MPRLNGRAPRRSWAREASIGIAIVNVHSTACSNPPSFFSDHLLGPPPIGAGERDAAEVTGHNRKAFVLHEIWVDQRFGFVGTHFFPMHESMALASISTGLCRWLPVNNRPNLLSAKSRKGRVNAFDGKFDGKR